MEATSNKLETAKNNQNSNKNKAKTAAAYSKKVEAESVKKGLMMQYLVEQLLLVIILILVLLPMLKVYKLLKHKVRLMVGLS